ncbi:hypothetical protein AMAG_07918 [Allomyces macrogynus ATCC 38327]|uniref:Transmembrane protein 231 n=1 Tax=Allomyces macrogynus (strain ATCC 38327) TaxID=578462 RepID=A0A0L0SJS6_ALLM3|nr:hypothetical protein AMAG_07918 [Allomyces macrogynus ATCC 38327]|eukprot:KNE62732.1 hypothetical protein AMAG_07918 [Allomyces macrogynus ATCC 38327]
MPWVDLLYVPLGVRYQAPLCSLATFLAVFATAIAAIVPFLLAYYADGFWISHTSILEQPDVRVDLGRIHVELQGSYLAGSPLALARGAASSDAAWQALATTNTSLMMRELAAAGSSAVDLRFPTVESIPFDHDRNGRMDRWDARISVPVADDETISAVTLSLALNVTWSKLSLSLVTPLTLVATSPPPLASDLTWDGDLVFTFAAPVPTNPTVIPRVSASMSPTTPSTRAPRARSRPLTLRVRLHVPTSPVPVRPSWAYMLKWAWVQYLAVGLLVTGVASRALGGVRERLVAMRVVDTRTVVVGGSAGVGSAAVPGGKQRFRPVTF